MLAIIIPYYNPYFFEQTLKSLVEQSDRRFKVYIGDDCSPHNPLSIIQKFEDVLDFQYVRFEKNLGQISLVKHWERCIALSQSEPWLMILGDDDLLGPEVVASFYKQQNTIDKANVSVIRYASCNIDETGKSEENIFQHPRMERATEAFFKTFKKISRSTLSEYVFTRKSYNLYGFRDYPLAWFSDNMAWLEFTELGEIYSINDAIVYVRTSPYSITGTGSNYLKKYESGFRFYSDILNMKPMAFTKMQRQEFIAELQNLMLKLKRLNFKNWGLIVGYWLKDLHLKEAFRITLLFLRKTYRNG